MPRAKNPYVVDITGQRFSRLVALRISGSDQYGRRIWECICDCGATAHVKSGNLRSGNTESCGCLLREHSRRIIKLAQARMRGPSHWKYNPHLTQEEREGRRSVKVILWRRAVYQRDGYTCVLCGEKGGRLHAHHLDSYAENPGKRFMVSNGVTLCVRHHKEFHATRGGERFPCSREDFDSYQRRWYPKAQGTSHIDQEAA